MCRPDFISYKWADRKNPGFLVNKKLFHAPVAAWTLHGEKDLRAAKRSFDMYIFELNDVSSHFYAHIGAGPKVFRQPMSKLMWA